MQKEREFKMKIAIASTGLRFDSGIDQRFARCTSFVFFDTDSGGVEFFPNPYKDADFEVGQKVAALMATKKVSKVIAGDFGIKIKPLLDSNQIQIIVYQDNKITIQEIISKLTNQYKP
jgi:predicted Fe-Mo cluster-binding NifX family protein